MAENRDNETAAQRREREQREQSGGDKPNADELRARREEAEGAHRGEPEEVRKASERADERQREVAKEDSRSDEQRRGVPPNPEGRNLGQEAMERELALSRTQGADLAAELAEDENRAKVGPMGQPLTWVMSNRRDMRVVAFWRDPAQPGGEAFIGPSPELVAVTPEVERLLMSGEVIEVPEPMRWLPDPENPEQPLRDADGKRVPNPAYPPLKTNAQEPEFAAQPGRPIPLGREPSPHHYSPQQITQIRRAQARIPAELPAPIGGIVPGVTHQVV